MSPSCGRRLTRCDMAIEALDVNYVHRIELACDTGEPKTVFLVRTLTLSQRTRVAMLSKDIGQALDGADMAKAVALGLEAWECLVVGIAMFGKHADTKQGPFGLCVPAAWFDANMGRPDVLFELVLLGLKCNMLSPAEKKTSAEGSGSPTSSPADAASAVRTETRNSPDASATAPSPPMPTATAQNSDGAPSH